MFIVVGLGGFHKPQVTTVSVIVMLRGGGGCGRDAKERTSRLIASAVSSDAISSPRLQFCLY